MLLDPVGTLKPWLGGGSIWWRSWPQRWPRSLSADLPQPRPRIARRDFSPTGATAAWTASIPSTATGRHLKPAGGSTHLLERRERHHACNAGPRQDRGRDEGRRCTEDRRCAEDRRRPPRRVAVPHPGRDGGAGPRRRVVARLRALAKTRRITSPACDRAGDDGQDRFALPPTRVRLPVLRDLRRHGLDVRLRPLRRP